MYFNPYMNVDLRGLVLIGRKKKHGTIVDVQEASHEVHKHTV